MTSAPLVVTLGLDERAQARFDAERARLFPAGRTQVGAHVTLFHALPGPLEDDVVHLLTAAADRPAFPVRVASVMSLGRGVAYRLASEELAAAHRLLRAGMVEHLTAQDAQPFRPHVTVQNKVTPEEARRTLAELTAGFTPYDVGAVGLDLWRYEGGPWTFVRRQAFG